jgi:CrcB protein
MKPHVVPAVAAGGAVGSLARYSVSSAFPHPPGEFPWSTLLVNVTGCLLIGVLMAVLATRPDPHPLLRPFLGIGVLGGYTTFSTYAVEVVDTAQTGAALALLYATATILLALSATAAGHRVTRTLLQ